MEKLDHWSYADTFTAIEAACLIKGINPNDDPAIDEKRVKPIIDRMRKDFDTTCWDVLSAAYDGENPETLNKYSEKGLLSIKLEELISDVASDDPNMDLFEFYAARRTQEEEQKKYPEDSEDIFIDFEMEKHFPFNEQIFCRKCLVNWIKKNDLKSQYVFGTKSNDLDKPLGEVERRNLLIIIAALCIDKEYDYTKHAKIAGIIHQTTTKMNETIGDSTIETHLKKIPDALKLSTYQLKSILKLTKP